MNLRNPLWVKTLTPMSLTPLPPTDDYEPPEFDFPDDPKVLSEIVRASMTQRTDETNDMYVQKVKELPLRNHYYFGPRVPMTSHRDPSRTVCRTRYSLSFRGLSTDLTFDMILENRQTKEILKEEEYTSITREELSRIIQYYLDTDS